MTHAACRMQWLDRISNPRDSPMCMRCRARRFTACLAGCFRDFANEPPDASKHFLARAPRGNAKATVRVPGLFGSGIFLPIGPNIVSSNQLERKRSTPPCWRTRKSIGYYLAQQGGRPGGCNGGSLGLEMGRIKGSSDPPPAGSEATHLQGTILN